MNVVTAIEDLIIGYIDGLTGLPDQINYPNTKKPIGSYPYVNVSILPGPTEQLEIGEQGMAIHEGILQLDVCVEVDSGTGEASTYQDVLINAFPRNTRLVGAENTLTFREPEPLAGRDDGNGAWVQGVQCSYFTYYFN